MPVQAAVRRQLILISKQNHTLQDQAPPRRAEISLSSPHLLPREEAKLLLAHGLRLNEPEAVALIASQLHECICDGQNSVAELMHEEKGFWDKDTVFLVTANFEAALYGSFLPIPPDSAFPILPEAEYASEKQPGAIITKKEAIVMNKAREGLDCGLQIMTIGLFRSVLTIFPSIEANPMANASCTVASYTHLACDDSVVAASSRFGSQLPPFCTSNVNTTLDNGGEWAFDGKNNILRWV
ncbi:hypothetical protein BDP27DRAFT_1378487 [Rhodocollybia butyracea]|uniref:Uncharacterized protein n=1 Tax=Rhodocollybia butyracea TaxID=206335 RepID=A0A9P5P583_9AGAR|nr:hypothetical protein BDP27DRAFT_1378487 [Rhodocollybia butyracea]